MATRKDFNSEEACAPCNRSKSARNVFDWCEMQGIEVPKIVTKLLKIQKAKALIILN